MAEKDREFDALETIVKRLKALTKEERWRVIGYVRDRFSAEDAVEREDAAR